MNGLKNRAELPIQETENCEPAGKETKFKTYTIFGKLITQDFHLALVF